ncbi:MAG: hypothetical protein LBG57_14415, partial [Treponema sp.]|nr:hypothetical protein [Treponema sp.]
DKENAQFCAFSTLQTPKGAQKSGIFAVKGRKNPQVPQAPGSLFPAMSAVNRRQTILCVYPAPHFHYTQKKPIIKAVCVLRHE